MARLFTPYLLRGMHARNRVVISPMQQYSAVDGMASDWRLAHLARFTMGGAGIVFVGSTAVEERGVDVVDCSSGDGISSYSTQGRSVSDSLLFRSELAARLREATGLQVMGAGLMAGPQTAENCLQAEQADLVARPLQSERARMRRSGSARQRQLPHLAAAIPDVPDPPHRRRLARIQCRQESGLTTPVAQRTEVFP